MTRLYWQALGVGLIFAAAGFSYSLASVPSDGRADGRERAASRPGRDLRYADPFILAGSDANFPNGGDVSADPDGFDLGDIAANVSFERSISALGGVKPYAKIDTNLANTGGGGIFLDPSGVLFGKSTAVGTNAVAFNATMTDARGNQRRGYFQLRQLTPASGDFRFAHDRLATAQVGQDYITTIGTVSTESSLPFFFVVPGSISLNGQAVNDLEFNGLTLFDDGTLAGRPIVSGTMTFTARATRNSIRAMNRAGTAEDQVFTLTVEAESSMQSLMATTQASIKGDYLRTTRGSISYKAQIDVGALSQRDFAGKLFIFRIAQTVYSTTLDSTGNKRNGDVRVKLNATKGEIAVTVKNTDTAILFPTGTVNNRGSKTVVVQIDAGESLRYTDAVEFASRSSSRNFSLSHKLGKQIQLGGLYQITRVKAAEFFEGTAYKIYFIQSPVLSDPFRKTGDGDVTVFFGGTFSQKVPLFRGNGKLPPDGVRTVQIANKTRRGKLQTYPLTAAETGVPKPSNSNGVPQTLYMGLDINTPTIFLSGDGTKTLFPFFR